MDQVNQLIMCHQCTKRRFNPKKGVVCSLTDEKPNFPSRCPDFNEDPTVDKVAARQIVEDAYRKTIPKQKMTTRDILITVVSIVIALIIVTIIAVIRINIRNAW